MRFIQPALAASILALGLMQGAAGSNLQGPVSRSPALERAFAGAQVVNLATSKSPSVVKLREIVRIPPPADPVLVKTFRRESLPDVLRPVFADPQISGVTISGRYIAILKTEFQKEYQDILQHELVHAYITLASPRPLPFWFQEGSAVHFSIDQGRKFYGRPAEDRVGVTVGKVVDLPDVYKNKLQNFHYMIEKVGKPRFYRWYRHAVMTGHVDPRPLLGLTSKTKAPRSHFTVPTWAIFAAGLGIIAASAAGYYALKRETNPW